MGRRGVCEDKEENEAMDATAKERDGVLEPRWSLGYRMVKRAFDVCFSAGVLVVLSPLMLLTAAAIKLDTPGSVIFAQKRVGKGGKIFRFYKFRSMVANAEELRDGLDALNEKDGPVFKIKDDPRITRVGRLLRRTSIDELPQFVNVLKGDMSVVGPRPPLPREVEQYTDRQRQRLAVRPGLTCTWQVQQYRDEIPFNEWVDMDLQYIGDASVVKDLRLIASTVTAVINAQGN